MTTKPLAALVLVLLSNSARAQPHPIRPTAVFELATVDAQSHATITAVHLWVNGAWTFEDFRQKTPRTTSGKISDDQLRALRAELARAPWQRRYVRALCPPRQVETEYSVDGTVVYTDPQCGTLLDDASLQALAYARGFVAGAIATPATAPCEGTGTPLVELADNERSLAVYRNGAWELATHVSGRPATKDKRCLAREVVERIALDVDSATWTQTPVVHCMIAATDRTTVSVDGKIVFVERVCNPYKLDELSARTLAEIERLTGWTAAPAPTCAAQGTPLVELDYDDLRQHTEQRAVKAWSTGAWAVDVTVDGRKTKTATGCLTRDAQKTITDDVAGAPWQVTQNAVTCKAMTTRSTVVKLGGKQVIVERLCGNESLDEASAKKLAEIQNVLADATK